VGDPPPETWNRVQRYASWMQDVRVGEGVVIAEDTVRQFRLNSPAGGWFPALRILEWVISENNLPYVDLLFSPLLERAYIDAPRLWNLSGFPRVILPTIASTISALPVSALRILCTGNPLGASIYIMSAWAHLKDSFSSVVLRCGPSLTHLSSVIPLSDAAVDHVIRLPHLRAWEIVGPPPSRSTPPTLMVFPPLRRLGLRGASAGGWLSLFQRLVDRVSVTPSVEPLYMVKESLTVLNAEFRPTATVIDVPLTSPIRMFRNLVDLNIRTSCHKGRCNSKLKNDEVAELAMALPRLQRLCLGFPCEENIRATTAACLLPISVHCLRLGVLSIHFNTTNIIDDLKNIPADPQFRELFSLPKCRLSRLDVRDAPLTLDESDFETVADGMKGIFPDLTGFDAPGVWYELSEKL